MAKKTFETALEQLELITEKLEHGNLSLDESLKIFDEGVKLTEFCNQKLNEAQGKISIHIKKGAESTLIPFESEKNDDP
ncbi:MAG: exodeoxyribonuclease VII small subunit [Proteobacteria bacterium]|nr:exodeoxyribonuclease VII small subunit [Pseudomonadota bacterium]MBU1711317.1 exodeoxyribonuclease VII small subunit [Pseudomonadota bacterium]